MTIDDLCQQFGISRRKIHYWSQHYATFPPVQFRGPITRYTNAHAEWIAARIALGHNSVSTRDADAYCRETGITLAQYVRQREQSIRDFGIGVA